MLRIRFTRTGKKKQPSYRIVVAEHSKAVKRQYIEILGHYSPSRNPKEVTLKEDRIKYWISVGAKPSDSVASLLKKEGYKDMEKYIVISREKKAKKKKEQPEEEAAAAAPAADAAPAQEEAPAAEAQPEPAAEAPAEDAAASE